MPDHLDVAERINAVRRSFEAPFTLVKPRSVALYFGCSKVQSVRVRHSPGGNEQMRIGNGSRVAVLLDLQPNTARRRAHAIRICVQQDLNSVLLKYYTSSGATL